VVLDVVEDERLAGAGPLRQPHDGAELDVPVDLGVDFGELALRLERLNPAAQVAEGDGPSFGGHVLAADLEHAALYTTRATNSVGSLPRGGECKHESWCVPPPCPSPASGGGDAGAEIALLVAVAVKWEQRLCACALRS